MLRTISGAAVAALTVAAVVLPAGAASAKAATIDDAKGDTYFLGFDDESGAPTFTESAKNVNVDLDKVVVRHTARRVELTARYFSLAKDGINLIAGGFFRTDDGSEWTMYGGASLTDEGWETYATLFESVGSPARTAGLPARGTTCEGLKVAVDWQADELVVSAPRSCMGGPAWVKAHAEAVGTYYDSQQEYHEVYDNAHTAKGSMNGWTGRIRKG